MGRLRRRTCKNCGELFSADHRNTHKQRYCRDPGCKQASKAASQKKWLAKKENRNYFRGLVNTQRVQQWRRLNPVYWKKAPVKQTALQDHWCDLGLRSVGTKSVEFTPLDKSKSLNFNNIYRAKCQV
jgi:hypothetical protein